MRRSKAPDSNIYKNKSYEQLKDISKNLEPILRIGKNGINENVISEINGHLERRRLIKIKLLPAFLDSNDRRIIALKLATKTNSKLVQQIGGIVVLYKK